MSTLFDITSDEPEKKRGARAKGRTPSEPDYVSQKTPFIYRKTAEIIAQVDDHFTCADESCAAWSHDIVEEDGAEWAIECAICGTGQRVRAIKGHLKPKPQEFAFRDGRFEGQTISQAATHPRGMDYLRWAAEGHPRQTVRDEVKTWLGKNADGR